MVKKLSVGIEIEGNLNWDLFEFEVGEYHEGEDFGLEGWSSESDSSLYPFPPHKIIKNPYGIEFVSEIFEGKKAFFQGVDNFIDFFSKNGKLELREVFYFNKSCGSHLHFSFSKDDLKQHKFYRKTYYKIFEKMRRQFINGIKKSKIKSKRKIIKHYFRSYAKNVLELGGYRSWNCEREAEFSILSEMRGAGIEWRSLNLIGIETWKEFSEFWKIVYSCLDKFSEYSLKYNIKENLDFIDKKELLLLGKKYKSGKIEEDSRLKGVFSKKRYSRFEINLGNKQIKEEDIIEREKPREEVNLECVI